jgi:hypothetical protein
LGWGVSEFELIRVAVHEDGAFGVLLHDGLPLVLTLERTFGDRVVIPPGEYVCRRTTFRKRGYATYEVFVPGHDRVLFHIGNTEEDTTGCVLLGLLFGSLGGKPAVLLSRLGFLEFMKRTAGRKEFRLRVREVT